MRFLKQATSVDLPLGPFLDETDGKTAETALTLTQPDIRLKKNGGAWAQKAAAQTLSHEEAGWYEVTLDATDTDTCGQLMLAVHESGALPVWCEFHVLEEAVYDALFAASAPGYLQPTTAGRTLDVSATGEAGLDWANIGAPTTAQNLSATNIDVDQIVASVSGAVGSVTGAVGSVTGAVGSVTGAVGSVATGGIVAASFAANAINAAKLDPDVTTELQAGLATAAALATVDGIVDDILLDTAEIGTAGAGLTNIDLPNQTMSITGNITGNLSGSVGSVTGAVGSVTAGVTLAASAVQAIWDALTSALTTAGSIGKLLVDNVNATISSRSSHVAADVWAVATRLLTAGTNIVLAKGTGVTGFNDLSAAQVNTEADTALSDYDPPTRAELTTDTNSILSKLLKYVQLTLRKDAAIATDNATEVTAINADGGSGAGVFANTTDAQEAIRDNMGTAQTGDSFARLGAPAGASVSADIAAIEAQTDDIGVAGAGLTALGDTRLANLDATISSRASQASVDDLPTNAELATSQAAADDATLAAIAALNNLSAAQVNAEVDTALVDIHLDHLLAVTYDPASQPGAADALLNELVESDAGVARYTANALEQAPTGGSAPTVGQIADAVWDETLADHLGAGSTGAGLNAAGSAGDPWATAIPGAYGAGTAGKIVGDNVNATVSSRSTQASLDTVDGIVDAILVDTTEIGAAGAGLTAIDLPNQTMNITGNITGNLSGSVGSVTGAVGSVTAGVTLAASAVQAIWDALTSALTTVGSVGKLLVDNVNATISSRSSHSAADVWTAGTRTLTSFGTLAADVWASATRLLTAGTNIVLAKGVGVTGFNDLSAAQVNAEADTALADVGVTSTVTGRIDAAVSTRATPAQVATELGTYDGPTKAELDTAVAALATSANLATVDTVVDSILALLIDARVEPGQGAPAATEDPLTKLDFLYKLARNRITQDATTLKVYADDAVTVDHKATVSDSGTLYDRGEIVTGP